MYKKICVDCYQSHLETIEYIAKNLDRDNLKSYLEVSLKKNCIHDIEETAQAQPQAQRSNRPEDLVDPFHDIQYLTSKKGL